jgi:hypothetical protein
MIGAKAYIYVKQVLEQEFSGTYLHFSNRGILHYELTNILEICELLTRGLDEEDRFLRNEVIGTIADYLQEI